jgi:hypothetical protein
MVQPRAVLAALPVAAIATLLGGGIALAHVHEQAGPYSLEIGWQNEPTYVGQVNGVAVFVHDQNDEPVTDLAPGDLTVVVSTGGHESAALALEPAFDEEEGFGTPGEYRATLLPTAPGDYTFHVSGTIHDQSVDVTVTSGEETFDSVLGPSEIEFPAKLPALTEIVTRLDRIDGRIEDLAEGANQSDVDAARVAAEQATATARDASAAAQQALIVGGGLGLAGVLVGALGVSLAVRARSRPA